ncbi:MAG TPA: DctP family TRAP transporter solute-binding subunit [Candidatus Limnocylindria bacterium]|nr:DctP family TRAP transporter solute-binding subunit [Candidatus Limnocylindria bacterium]
MKKRIALIALLLVAALMTGIATASAATLKMAITASETSSWYAGAKIFKQIVEEKTNGRYTVELYPNEQLASGNQQRGVEMLYTGETDVDLHSTMIHSNIEPKLAAISMPFAYKTLEEVDAKLINDETALAAIRELVESKGAVLLGIGENGFRQITNSKREIRTPADLERLKIRVPNIQLNLDIFRALGADPTAMAFGEVYTALQQGTIDGQENPLDTIRSNNIQEVQKFISLWNYSYDPILLAVSQDLWNSLSDADKAIFQEAGQKAMEEQRTITRARNVALEKEFADAGLKVSYLTDAEKQAFKDALGDLIKTYEEKLGKDLLTALHYYD